MYINHNGMASNVANTLTSHYSNLATSTQRLSSGLRVNSAADDAAGLAIRELMRADISALNQGVRNANDAISMIQTADGALGIIDEKLIRMKELAEQAATGTYDSTQRLMIESEYQQMASEITRIANSTDFNGMKLLDGSLEGTHDGSKLDSTGAMKIHFGTGNDSAEDYYYVEIGEVTAAALGVGNQSTFEDVTNRAVKEFTTKLQDEIKNNKDLTDAQKGELLAQVDATADNYRAAIENAIDPHNAHKFWGAGDNLGGTDTSDDGFLVDGKNWAGNSTVINDYMGVATTDPATLVSKAIDDAIKGIDLDVTAVADGNTGNAKGASTNTAVANKATQVTNALTKSLKAIGVSDTTITKITTDVTKSWNDLADDSTTMANAQTAIDNWQKAIATDVKAAATANLTADDKTSVTNTSIDNFMDGLRTSEKEKLNYAFGQAAMYNLAHGDDTNDDAAYGMNLDLDLGFGTDSKKNVLDTDNAMLKSALSAAYDKVKDMDVAGQTIETQEDAQHALEALNDAIVQKDKVRAHLGALQNRLENTVSNLTIQAENLQAAESRISDVDVATEMTNFVRNQILTQSAVAMLSQANSMPQMAMQLIG